MGDTTQRKPLTKDVERFLFMLRFNSRGKVNALGRYADPEADKKGYVAVRVPSGAYSSKALNVQFQNPQPSFFFLHIAGSNPVQTATRN